jgi:multiple sugar transport system permease protein
MPALLSLTPPVVLALPLVVFYAAMGLIDTLVGLALVYGGTSAFYVIWITKPFIDAVPREVEEAARVDGEDSWAIPFTIILPIIASGVIATIFFVFLLNWTGFVLALSLTRSEARTLPLALTAVRGLGAVSQAEGTAAAVGTLSLAPFFAVSYFAQRYFIRVFALRLSGR